MFTIIKPLLKYWGTLHKYFLSRILSYNFPILAIINCYNGHSNNLMWLFKTLNSRISKRYDHPVANFEHMLIVLFLWQIKWNINYLELKLVGRLVLVNAIHIRVEFLQMWKESNAWRAPVCRKEQSETFNLLQLLYRSVFNQGWVWYYSSLFREFWTQKIKYCFICLILLG